MLKMEELVTYVKLMQSVNLIKVVTLSFYGSFSRVITGAVNTSARNVFQIIKCLFVKHGKEKYTIKCYFTFKYCPF